MVSRALLLSIAVGCGPLLWSQSQVTVTGRVVDPMGMVVPATTVQATDPLGRVKAETAANDAGEFAIQFPGGASTSLVARKEGFEPIATDPKPFNADTADVILAFGKLQSASEVLTVTARVVEPSVDQRDQELFNRTLFTRDDQVFQTLGAGLSLGQHAGGGKSLEVRRFGFNLDHGGTGGGLKVMLDNIQQNQVSGGHAHGYLGALKGLSPELVQDVSLINGPFNAQYGDFSGLGVVNIKSKDEMPDRVTGRLQFGQFNTRRLFGAYSPQWENTQGLIAIESSYSDGPYLRPLAYKRNNLTGVWSRKLKPTDTLAFRFYGSTNDFFSAGQLPLDQIEAGKLDRFGFVDPTDGGVSKSGTLAAYYTKENPNGSIFKVDGMVNRLLFDLFSNFTFFLKDPVRGDAFGQHDSRLQEAANAQYQRPHSWGMVFGTFTGGASYLDNQINLKLYGREGRVPTDIRTASNARIANTGFYGQENLVMAGGKLRLDAGLRYDTLHYGIQDQLTADPRSARTGGAWQPKLGIAYTPNPNTPFTFHANYGRAITSTNSRTLISRPGSPLIANTDFFQAGAAYNRNRVSGALSAFWIDRSNELIYVADEGTTEFVGPSRSTGWEAKTSYQISPSLSWNGSITKVMNAFYRGTSPREYVDRAPHFTAYTSFTASGWRGWSGSLRMRAINRYILNGEEAQSIVPGHTVFDISVARTVNRWLELNFAVDNILNKFFYETFERYTSRLPGQDPLERVHGTPGYPRTIMGGLTIRLFPKPR